VHLGASSEQCEEESLVKNHELQAALLKAQGCEARPRLRNRCAHAMARTLQKLLRRAKSKVDRRDAASLKFKLLP